MSPRQPWYAVAITIVVVASALLLPLIVQTTGEDSFRFPKELGLRVFAILIAAVFLVALALGELRLPPPREWFRSQAAILIAVILGWSVITTITSTNRFLSLGSLSWIVAMTIVFGATVYAARRNGLWLVTIAMIPALVNGAVYALQEMEIWNPFPFESRIELHLTRTALVGNPNDVGSYLVAPAMAAFALTIADRRRRVMWLVIALLLSGAILMTQTLTAVIALMAGLAVMALVRSPRLGLAAVAIALVSLTVAFLTLPPLRTRLARARAAIAAKDYDDLISARSTAFLAAAQMTRDHPLFGVGPGAFGWNYFDYKMGIETRSPRLAAGGARMFNYGAVHNDHLQVSSETGLPGYALMLAAMILLGSLTVHHPRDETPRDEWVTVLGLPLAVAFFVLALAQFPLELVAPSHAFLYQAALLIAWRPR